MTWEHAVHRRCSRRTFLAAGALGGLSLAGYLRLAAAAPPATSRSGILVFLQGGPSHQDTFDLKPQAPAEYRGEFGPIATRAPGVEICQHLPRLAACADKFAVLRGISHNLAAHDLGTRYVLTGNRPTPLLQYPEFGCVASRELPAAADLPAYVSIDRELQGPGYLGIQYAPLCTGEKPRANEPFRVRGIALGDGLTLPQFRARRQLRDDLDTHFDGWSAPDDEVRGLDRFSQQAYDIISSPRAREAFDLQRVPTALAARFGTHEFGRCLLLALRLVEAGVRFVTVILDGWDTHQQNFQELRQNLLPGLDAGLAALLESLDERGLLDSTAVLVTGEFGRTPKINGNRGRDHWAQAMCALLAGAGVRGGQAIGATDDKAAEPAGDAYSPDDLAATFFTSLGIDPQRGYDTAAGRPVTLVRDGRVIPGVF